MPEVENNRQTHADVAPLFTERWSTRAFSSEPLTDDEIAKLFEASRWAPSSGNSQPWMVVYETDGPDRATFDSVLRPGNQKWAPSAPLLGYFFAKNNRPDGSPLGSSQFDTGSAWMSLAMQATMMGLHAHAMGGIEKDAVYEKLGVSSDEYTVICAFVVGHRGDVSALEEDLQARDKPNDRDPVSEHVTKGVVG
ncbi:MAG: nitroreductase family protein [Chloroflexi bacterium]|nr:nitroreductase family protein [Chloroflexota bacterium]